jgi:hypothetical protein
MTSGPLSIGDAEYDAIEAAVLETARGRWFLAEYARRNRHTDTDLVLDSIAGMKEALRELEARINAMLATADAARDAIAYEAEAEESSDPLRLTAPADIDDQEALGEGDPSSWPDWDAQEAEDEEPIFAAFAVEDDPSLQDDRSVGTDQLPGDTLSQAAPPMPVEPSAPPSSAAAPSRERPAPASREEPATGFPGRAPVKSRLPNAITPPPIYRRPHGDPLAAIRALGYEEKIALFT